MRTLLVFLIFPFAIQAQETKTAPVKPSTTDCPTWKNKAQVSKANYFESLRHTKNAKAQPVANASKKEIPEKKQPVEHVAPKTQKATVPSFSAGEDKVMSEKKEIPDKPEEKPIAEKHSVKETKEATAATTKPKAEKKTQKKKDTGTNSGRVRKTCKDPQKCPSF